MIDFVRFLQYLHATARVLHSGEQTETDSSRLSGMAGLLKGLHIMADLAYVGVEGVDRRERSRWRGGPTIDIKAAPAKAEA